MKKFIALGVALMVLLFNFVPTANVAENDSFQVVDDLRPNTNPHDDSM